MKPLPPPIKIIIPKVESSGFFEEKPTEDVQIGASEFHLSCAAGASFRAGDKMIFGYEGDNLFSFSFFISLFFCLCC